MLSSADGKTTKGNNDNIYTWTSVEDQRYFLSLIKKNNLIIMGRDLRFFETDNKIKKRKIKNCLNA
ncbi:MAG: hypothetical protein WC741_04055 [Patescibacteria group bacterium]